MPTIVADRIQLQQVVLNLLRNAIEATDSAPLSDASRAITIEATLAGDNQLSLCVADRGPGVPEGDIERVFEAFYSTKISGLGIGLSLCRKLIEAHGGSLVAKRRSGGGAAFEFTLPLTDEGEGDPSP
jgi:two-component system sensor kinase FixL